MARHLYAVSTGWRGGDNLLKRQSRELARQSDRPDPAFRQFFNGPELWASDGLWRAFRKWQKNSANTDYERFRQYYRERREAAVAAVEAWQSPFVNAKKGEPYHISFRVPDCAPHYRFFGLDKAGLTLENPDPRTCVVSGVPRVAGTFPVNLFYIWPEWTTGLSLLKRDFSLLVNPDPRELWEDVPSDPAAEYARPDLDCAVLVSPEGLLAAASRRGRSHAHSGAPRDDAFALGSEFGWQVLVVADGAGSAQFSRKGAQLACETALAAVVAKLAQAQELEAIFAELEPGADPQLWQPKAKKLAYAILPNAAFEAARAIRQEAEAKGREQRAYATTLLLALAKRYGGGWAVMSFQIGDGAMALLTGDSAALLARPDEGEYGGQTRFVTMNEIFEPHELMRRLRLDFVAGLEALLLMTDGVSDARFTAPEELADHGAWRRFWGELAPLAKSEEPGPELLEWLNFWSRGNHDDRTLAIFMADRDNDHQ